MKLEDQVCTFEQAKRLAELGIVQDSLFYWKENEIQTVVTDREMKSWIDKYLPACNKYYSAFTIAELIQMNENVHNIDASTAREGKWFSTTNSSAKLREDQFTYYDTFAEACADKLIRAIELEYETVETFNKRLQK